MELIIDRFEDEYAICEDKDKKILNINKSKIPKQAKEGDIIIYREGEYILDKEKTLNRKKYIEELTKDLWE